MKRNILKCFLSLAIIIPLASCSHEHTFGEEWKYDESGHYHECLCGERSEVTAHTLTSELVYDDTNHFYECECGYIKDKEAHLYIYKISDDHHYQECECGSIITNEEHEYGDWIISEDSHHRQCVCGDITESGPHVYDDGVIVVETSNDQAGSKKYTCVDCGKTKIEEFETAPEAPRNLKVNLTLSTASLSWEAPKSNGGKPIEYYEVSCGESNEDENWVTAEDDGSHLFTNLDYTKKLVYKVRAINENGEGIAAERDKNITGPSEVTNFTVAASRTNVYLNWTAPVDDGGSPITAVLIKIGEAQWKRFAHNIVGLTLPAESGVPTVCSIRAINAYYHGEISAKTVVPGGYPDDPDSFSCVFSNSQITLSWSEPDYIGDSPIIRYDVMVEGDDWIDAGLKTSYTFENLLNNKTYGMRVRAVNESGPSIGTRRCTGTIIIKPEIPTNIECFAGERFVQLYWDPPLGFGNNRITYLCSINDSDVLSSIVSGHKYSNLDPDTDYVFKLKASTDAGESEIIDIKARTNSLIPAPPTMKKHYGGDNEYYLNWDEVEDSSILYYEVRVDREAWINIGLVDEYTFKNYGNDIARRVMVRAVNASGPSAPTVVNNARGLNRVPDAPSILNFQRIISSGRIQIAWSRPSNVTNYSLKYYEIRLNNEPWIQVESTTYAFESLSSGKTYTVYVRAVTNVGRGLITERSTILATMPKITTFISERIDNDVTLNWDAPTDGSYEGSIINYEVCISSFVSGRQRWIDVGLETSYTFEDLAIGDDYTFYVRAITEYGAGDETSCSSSFALPPRTVTIGDYTIADMKITINWSAPLDSGDAPVLGYQVKNGTGSWTDVGLVTTHEYKYAINGYTFIFYIRAYNVYGVGPEISVEVTTPLNP